MKGWRLWLAVALLVGNAAVFGWVVWLLVSGEFDEQVAVSAAP